jgi:hypothetical protein
MGKYMLSIIKEGKVKTFVANSANHAKKIRAQYVPDKSVIISPIVNLEKQQERPLQFMINNVFIRGEKLGKERNKTGPSQ